MKKAFGVSQVSIHCALTETKQKKNDGPDRNWSCTNTT